MDITKKRQNDKLEQSKHERESERKRDEQINALIELVKDGIKQQSISNEQQNKWMDTIQKFTATIQQFATAIGENNLKSAEERTGIKERQDEILDIIRVLTDASNKNTEVLGALAKDISPIGVLLKVLILRADQNMSHLDLTEVKEEIVKVQHNAVSAINEIVVIEESKKAEEKKDSREDKKPKA